MSTVKEIQDAVAQLTDADKEQLFAWIRAEFDWEAWDRQIEADCAAGRLDHIIAQVDREIDDGHHTKL